MQGSVLLMVSMLGQSLKSASVSGELLPNTSTDIAISSQGLNFILGNVVVALVQEAEWSGLVIVQIRICRPSFLRVLLRTDRRWLKVHTIIITAACPA